MSEVGEDERADEDGAVAAPHGEVALPRPAGAEAGQHGGEPLGVAVAAVVGYLILPQVGWRWVLVASSATALIALAARRSMHLPNDPGSSGPLLAPLRHRPDLVWRLGAAWLLGVFKLGTYWTCYTWLPSFLLHEMHQARARSLTWMLTAAVGQLLGMLSFGVMADRAGRRPAFTAYSVLTAAALALLAFAWPWLSDHPFFFWTTMFALGVGAGCTAGFGALLAELFPTEIRGAAMGATYNLARAAQLLAPVVVHMAVGEAGLAGGLSVPLVLALATASWVWVLPETRGIPLPRLGPAAAPAPGAAVTADAAGP
ncbi:MAG: MFS transporter [Myxococcales bacterium]|nr:MFS transporter [Myxococcales bacterium]